MRIIYEYQDAPVGVYRGREETYITAKRKFYWPRQYQFVRKYIQACEVCQRVKSSPSLRAPLHHLPVRQSARTLSQWNLASDSPLTHTRILVFLCPLTGADRYCTWLLYPNPSTQWLVPESLSTRSFAPMRCLMNSCPIGNRCSQLSSGVSCSKRSERA